MSPPPPCHPRPPHIPFIMTVAVPGERADEHAFLDSVEGEITFFRSIMRARPIGMHRYFHVLAIRSAILKDTGRAVHPETIWEKLRKCYDLDALDAIVRVLLSAPAPAPAWRFVIKRA